MIIDLISLKAALCKAINDYELIHDQTSVELDEDFYWRIPDASLFDLTVTPNKFEVGSLSEEFLEIKAIMSQDGTLGAVSIQHLAGILAWISAKSSNTA